MYKKVIPSIDRKLILFLATFIIYTMFIGSISKGHEWSRYSLTRAIVESQSFDIGKYSHLAWPDYIYFGDRVYSALTPAVSFLAIPFYVVGNLLGLADQCVVLLSIIFTSLTVVLVYEVCSLIGVKEKSAMLTSLVYAFGTLAWPYSKTFSAHPTSAFLVLLSVYLVMKSVGKGQENFLHIMSAGICLGYASFVEYQNGVFLFPILLYILSFHPKIKTVLAFLASFSLGLSCVFAYNYVCFIDPLTFPEQLWPYWEPKHTLFSSFSAKPWETLPQLLFSPYRGFFFYSPVLLISIFGFHILLKGAKKDFLLFVFLFITDLFLFSFWRSWMGGWCYGPRFLVVVTPFLTVPLSKLFDKYWQNTKFWVMFSFPYIVSVALSALGALFKPFMIPDTWTIPPLLVYTSLIEGVAKWDSWFFPVTIDSWLFSHIPVNVSLIAATMLVLIVTYGLIIGFVKK